MDLKNEVQQIAEAQLQDPSHFIVDVVISATKGPKKIRVFMDGDDGVSIDDCATVSRKVGNIIEENELIDDRYTLEVSSPGVDYPLANIRQYKKNIGRNLKVTLNESKDIKGELKAVDDNGIQLFEIKGKGKKKTEELHHLKFEDIKKSIVQISFK